jgi:hypothetical protein
MRNVLCLRLVLPVLAAWISLSLPAATRAVSGGLELLPPFFERMVVNVFQAVVRVVLISVLSGGFCTSIACAQRVIVVSTAHQLIESIGSDRILQIAAGDYQLTGVFPKVGDGCKWEGGRLNPSLTVSGLRNLTLKGAGAAMTRLLVAPPDAIVLAFEKMQNLTLEGIQMGHTTKPGGCNTGVVDFEDCSRVQVTECDLFGSGILGIYARSVHGLSVRGSTIRDCSQAILTISDCTDVTFSSCTFRKNGGGMTLSGAGTVAFKDCQVVDNSTLHYERLSPLITVEEGCRITFTGGRVSGNTCSTLLSGAEMKVLEGTTITDNKLNP